METPEHGAARSKRDEPLSPGAIRVVCAFLPLIGAGVLFPWSDTFGQTDAPYTQPSVRWQPPGKRYDNDTTAGVLANKADLLDVKVARIESFVLMGIAVFIAAPRRR